MSSAEKPNVKDDAGFQRDGQQNTPQASKHENATTKVQSMPTTEKTSTPQKSQELER